jgi:hypothetical protein
MSIARKSKRATDKIQKSKTSDKMALPRLTLLRGLHNIA